MIEVDDNIVLSQLDEEMHAISMETAFIAIDTIEFLLLQIPKEQQTHSTIAQITSALLIQNADVASKMISDHFNLLQTHTLH